MAPPPILKIHGNADRIVPYQHAVRLHNRRTSQAHGGRRSPECETFFHAMTPDLAISCLDEAGRAQRDLP